jgi:hypothetical protein
MANVRARDVFAVWASLLVVPAFVACGARSELGGGPQPLDASTDARDAADVGADRDADAHDADVADTADARDAADTNVQDAPIDAPLDVPDAGGATLVLTCIAVTQDRVQPGDQGLAPDGQPDGELSATGAGAFDALILVTVDANGKPAFGQQWDTLVGQDPIPQGYAFQTGAQTWILGVWENGVRANDNQGRIALPAGPHTLALFAASSGFFNQGARFRLYGRTNGVWISSNVAPWP